jgi:hypothetical protein
MDVNYVSSQSEKAFQNFWYEPRFSKHSWHEKRKTVNIYALHDLSLYGTSLSICFIGRYDCYVMTPPGKFERNLVNVLFHAADCGGKPGYNLDYMHV